MPFFLLTSLILIMLFIGSNKSAEKFCTFALLKRFVFFVTSLCSSVSVSVDRYRSVGLCLRMFYVERRCSKDGGIDIGIRSVKLYIYLVHVRD